MNRLIEYTVFSEFVTDWRLATCPTRRSPPLPYATTEGVVRPPSEFAMTSTVPPSRTATTLFVVPRSIPMILLISDFPSRPDDWIRGQSKILARHCQVLERRHL